MTERENIVALVRHELSINRKTALCCAGVVLALLVIALTPLRELPLFEPAGDPKGTPGAVWLLLRSILTCAVLLIPASLFAHEVKRGTMGLLLALPVSRKALLLGKVLGGVILVGGVVVGLAATDLVAASVDPSVGDRVYLGGFPPRFKASLLAAVFASSLAGGLLTASTVAGALLGMAMVTVPPVLVIMLSAAVAEGPPFAATSVVLAIEAAIAAILSYHWLSRLEPRRVAS
ncbi:ABC transporter permease subunit [Planctomycetota bacterium]